MGKHTHIHTHEVIREQGNVFLMLHANVIWLLELPLEMFSFASGVCQMYRLPNNGFLQLHVKIKLYWIRFYHIMALYYLRMLIAIHMHNKED